MLAGFVSIGPTSAEDYPESFFKNIKVPTLVLWGDKYENMEKKKSKLLMKIPKSQGLSISNAGLALYLDNTKEWEKVLYNFLVNLLPDAKKDKKKKDE